MDYVEPLKSINDLLSYVDQSTQLVNETNQQVNIKLTILMEKQRALLLRIVEIQLRSEALQTKLVEAKKKWKIV